MYIFERSCKKLVKVVASSKGYRREICLHSILFCIVEVLEMYI